MTFSEFIERHDSAFKPLFEPPLTSENTIYMDFSRSNHEFDGMTPAALDAAILSKLAASKARAGVGGYLENRNMYRDTELFKDDQERSIHVGVDVFIPAGAALAPILTGEVHSFANRRQSGDYGPVIILRHRLDGFEFHSLYGHLSLSSLQGLTVGKTLTAGEPMAEIGPRSVNGNWPPHLHFQLIRDLQGYQGDYPGVVRAQELDFFKKNCPDPTPLLLNRR